ncbi:hypothetical protein [Rubinisphaera italica]|uniref:hypothetical protein n=1 Tax=Rubinisphaera italica TaxID=2527969 RepID=UPI0013EF2969|nr:hypothetical protein [Rubinisphaera italica]
MRSATYDQFVLDDTPEVVERKSRLGAVMLVDPRHSSRVNPLTARASGLNCSDIGLSFP